MAVGSVDNKNVHVSQGDVVQDNRRIVEDSKRQGQDGTALHDPAPEVPGPATLNLATQGDHLVSLPASVTGGDETVLTLANLIQNRANPGRTGTFILPYGAAKVNLSRPPVLFVHGMFGNLDRFAAMVEWAHKQGRQVYVAKYDTGDTKPAASAEGLTARLEALEALYGGRGSGISWDLITHSMGGPVMQLVLETMWTRRDATVRWVAFDPPAAGRPGRVFDGLSGLFGGTGDVIDELEPDAALYSEQMYSRGVPPGRLTYVNVASEDTVAPSLGNFSSEQLDRLMAVMQPEAGGATDLIVRNLLRNLRQDARFPALSDWLGEQAEAATPEAFREHATRLGFIADGDHNSIMRNAELLEAVFGRWLSPAPRQVELAPILEDTELL